MTPADRQSHQEESAAKQARIAAEEREREEQEFWDRAFCAVLGVEISGSIDEDVDYASRAADAALAARRARKNGGRDGTP